MPGIYQQRERKTFSSRNLTLLDYQAMTCGSLQRGSLDQLHKDRTKKEEQSEWTLPTCSPKRASLVPDAWRCTVNTWSGTQLCMYEAMWGLRVHVCVCGGGGMCACMPCLHSHHNICQLCFYLWWALNSVYKEEGHFPLPSRGPWFGISSFHTIFLPL